MAPTNLSEGLYMKDSWSQPWGLLLARDRMELFIELSGLEFDDKAFLRVSRVEEFLEENYHWVEEF
jgi:hypothetical protein